MADDLLRYRSEFPILERTNYMISNSLGAMPRGVYDALQAYAETWATRGVRAWEERWWMLAAEVGNELGALMNAPPGSVSTHPNVTTARPSSPPASTSPASATRSSTATSTFPR